MITVTLGTSPYPFQRAIDWIKFLLESRVIQENVFIQCGSTDVSSVRNHPLVVCEELVSIGRLTDLIDQSNLVISHAGDGSTRLMIAKRSRFVLLPRLAIHGEHVDNHQLDFVKGIHQFGIEYCLTIKDLEKYVKSPPNPCRTGIFGNAPLLLDHLLKVYGNGAPQFPEVSPSQTFEPIL